MKVVRSIGHGYISDISTNAEEIVKPSNPHVTQRSTTLSLLSEVTAITIYIIMAPKGHTTLNSSDTIHTLTVHQSQYYTRDDRMDSLEDNPIDSLEYNPIFLSLIIKLLTPTK